MRLAIASVLALAPVSAICAPVQLTTGPGNDTEAAWSPDGTRICFQSDRNGTLDLFVLDVDTREVRPLTSGPAQDCFPAWSPDGTQIAFARGLFTGTAVEARPEGYHIFVVDAAGGEPRRLTSGRFIDYLPTWSPEGSTIWFSSTRDAPASNATLFSVPAEGGEVTILAPSIGGEACCVEPSFSPNGSMFAVAFIDSLFNNWSIRLAETARPSVQYPITEKTHAWYSPAWCPTADLIACSSSLGDNGWDIYVIQAFGEEYVRVTDTPCNERSPAWNPEGKRLVYESNQTGTYKLYVVDAPALEAAPRARGFLSGRLQKRFGYLDDDLDAAHGALSFLPIGGTGGFGFDYRSRSAGLDLSAPLTVVEVELTNDKGKVPSALGPENLTLWVSDDNRTYTQVPQFACEKRVVGNGEVLILSGFEVTARFIKVHQNLTSTDPNTTFAATEYTEFMRVSVKE
jgi:dipeptidyl aminopeptidase/acylaminoacyl peptidase